MVYFGKGVVGIVGGLGPQTTSEFYLGIVSDFRKKCHSYPHLIIDSVPFSISLERDIIQNSVNEENLLPVLENSIKRLNKIKVDFIVIPCNTAHIFIKKLENISLHPILSVVQETSEFISKNNYKSIGLLATTKTIQSKIYEDVLIKSGINVILPTKEEQMNISKTIINILENKAGTKDQKMLMMICDSLFKRGAEAIVLGCTDLQLILRSNPKLKLIDSMEILKESVLKKLMEDNHG